jgi:putative spermidine/putrescine transport system ATP-binding protein
MRTGRIEQVGTPFDIYNHPANPFVASFIGTLNVLEATVADPAQARLAVAGQEVFAAAPLAAGSGQGVRLSLRPEMLALVDGTPVANRLGGTLANVVFLGSIVRLVIEVGGQEVFLDQFNAPHLTLPAVGAQVQIGFPREACLVIGSEPAAGEPQPASV